MNRFFTKPELIAEYRLRHHVHDQLFAEVSPAEKTVQGEPLFLESHVDAWLTARYAVAPWRSGCATHGLQSISTVPHIKAANDENCFVTVAEAQRRYLGGERSRRWWYRLAETGRIAHHRVGDSIFFRTDDIEKFIAESRKAEHAERPGPNRPRPFLSSRRQRSTSPGGSLGRKSGFSSFHDEGKPMGPARLCSQTK